MGPDDKVDLSWITGSTTPASLSLSLQDHLSLEHGVSMRPRPQGAILIIDLEKNAVLEIYQQIRKLAQTMQWQLPA